MEEACQSFRGRNWEDGRKNSMKNCKGKGLGGNNSNMKVSEQCRIIAACKEPDSWNDRHGDHIAGIKDILSDLCLKKHKEEQLNSFQRRDKIEVF